MSAKSATAVKVILAKQPEEPLGHEADDSVSEVTDNYDCDIGEATGGAS